MQIPKYNCNEIVESMGVHPKRLGFGGTTTVFAGFFRNEHVAIKHTTYKRGKVGAYPFSNELSALRAIGLHPNIIEVVGFSKDSKKQIGYVVFRRIYGKTLDKKINIETTWYYALSIIIDIVLAISTIHGHDLVHRDLKPCNIMIADAESSAKVIDFGSCVKNGESISEIGCTRGYIKPIALNEGVAKKSHDTYTIGIVLLEVFMKKWPNFCRGSGSSNEARRMMRSEFHHCLDKTYMKSYRNKEGCTRNDAISVSKLVMQCVKGNVKIIEVVCQFRILVEKYGPEEFCVEDELISSVHVPECLDYLSDNDTTTMIQKVKQKVAQGKKPFKAEKRRHMV